MKGLKQFTVMLSAMCLSGCMATASIPGDKDLARYLRRGEKVTVYTTDGSVTTMFVGKVKEKELTGSRIGTPYKRVNIPRGSIAEVHAERVHAGKTFGAIVLGTILIPPVILFCGLDDFSCLDGYQGALGP
jgi:hypothetical protein